MNRKTKFGSAIGVRLRIVLLAALAFGAVGFLPLFGGPGYEHAFATGLLAPSLAAVGAALSLRSSKKGARARLTSGALFGLLLALVSLGTALLHLVRVPLCDPFAELPLFVLGPLLGSVLGGVWGAGVSLAPFFVRTRKRTVLFALLGPLGCVLVGLYRFYSSPMIFAYDPFVGYFSGSLYDTIIDPGVALYTYRAGTLATLCAAFLAAALRDGRDEAVRRERRQHSLLRLGFIHPWKALGCVLASSLSLANVACGTRLDHFHTPASIQRELGAELSGPRCTVVFPRTLSDSEAKLLLRDCEMQLQKVEKAMEARGPERVVAYFFRDAGQKKRLMGAANTYIAKPWRQEVYLQVASFPHPVLAHELAHVVSGQFGQGPFKVAGSVGGLLPNPGLVEGIAEATAPPPDDELSPMAWAKAMRDMGLLPPMSQVFSLAFMGESSAKSYTLAAAWITFVRERYGMQVVRAWYSGQDLSALTQKPWATLEQDFVLALEQYEISPSAKAYAEARFKRPSVFRRRCPHLLDRLRMEGDACREGHDLVCAREKYDEVRGIDPKDAAAELSLAALELRYGAQQKGIALLETLSKSSQASQPIRDRAEELLVEHQGEEGPYPCAFYATRRDRAFDEDVARTYEVKAIACNDEQLRKPVLNYLNPQLFEVQEALALGAGLGDFFASPKPLRQGLVRYLLGKSLARAGHHHQAALSLHFARELLSEMTPQPKRILREALRQEVASSCALADRKALEAIESDRSWRSAFEVTPGGRKAALEGLLQTCLSETSTFRP
jgi:hypothetical protein